MWKAGALAAVALLAALPSAPEVRAASPGLVVVETDGSTVVREGGPGDTYTVALASQPTADVRVLEAEPHGELRFSPQNVLFTTDDWSRSQIVTVTAVDDTKLEPSPHRVAVEHSVTSADRGYDSIWARSISVSIIDNDDIAPPRTTFGTANGSIIVNRHPPFAPASVHGQTTDNWSGVEDVKVTFRPLIGQARESAAILTCGPGALVCAWRAELPTSPGRYLVQGRGRDAAGNVESPGPTIYVVIA